MLLIYTFKCQTHCSLHVGLVFLYTAKCIYLALWCQIGCAACCSPVKLKLTFHCHDTCDEVAQAYLPDFVRAVTVPKHCRAGKPRQGAVDTLIHNVLAFAPLTLCDICE